MKAFRRLPLTPVDPKMQAALVQCVKDALEKAEKAEATGFTLVILNRDGTFSTESYFDRKLELMGALSAAQQHIYYIDHESEGAVKWISWTGFASRS